MSGPARILKILSCTLVISIVGCDTLHNAGVPGLERYTSKPDTELLAKVKSCREKFVEHRDHESLYWLLSHRIANGMTLQDVEEVIGDPGEYTTDFKSPDKDGGHQTTDSAYKWGPDSTGRSVVIWFRDGHVCNFDGKYYKEKDWEKDKKDKSNSD